MPIEISDADVEAFGGDRDKLASWIENLPLESERVKARQAVIDQKDAALRQFTELGLTVDEIKALKDGASDAPTDKDIEKRIQKALDEATAVERAKSDAKARAAEVRAQAAELGFIKPTQALALLDQKKLAEIAVNDDGDADEAAVKKLLEALAEDSPHLIKPTDTTPDHRTAGIGGTGSGTKPEVRPGADRLRQAYANNK